MHFTLRWYAGSSALSARRLSPSTIRLSRRLGLAARSLGAHRRQLVEGHPQVEVLHEHAALELEKWHRGSLGPSGRPGRSARFGTRVALGVTPPAIVAREPPSPVPGASPRIPRGYPGQAEAQPSPREAAGAASPAPSRLSFSTRVVRLRPSRRAACWRLPPVSSRARSINWRSMPAT